MDADEMKKRAREITRYLSELEPDEKDRVIQRVLQLLATPKRKEKMN